MAYFVTESRGDLAAEELKRHLGVSLPLYMVPSHFVQLGSLPLNANGKVDRSALPAPKPPIDAPQGHVEGGLESRIAALWSRILRRAVGRDDNFFDLGGSSLQLIELHAELAKISDVEVPLVKLFEHATVRSLATHLSGSQSVASASTAAGRAKLQREAFARRSRVKEPGR